MAELLKSVIVTGAGSGIGRGAALELAQRGMAVGLVGRTQQTLEAVAETIRGAGGKAIVIVADVSDHRQAERMARESVAAFGRIDGLVNNAGRVAALPLAQMSPEQWMEAIQGNLSAAFFASRAVWGVMERQGLGRAGGGGVIVNISSMAARDPFPGLGAYAAAKAGVNMLTLVLGREGAPAGIRVIGLAPASVDTPMFRGLMGNQPVDEALVMDAAEVGAVIADAVTGRLSLASGETIYLHKRPA